MEFSLGNKLIIGLFATALIIDGSSDLNRLPIDALTDISNNQVQLTATAYPYGATYHADGNFC